MKTVKIIFVFMYLKVQELCKVFKLLWMYLWGECALPACLICLGLSAVGIFGGILLSIWHWIGPVSAMAFINHASETASFTTRVVLACFGLGSLTVIGLMIVAVLGFIFMEYWHHVPDLIVDNWKKATQIVGEE